MMLKKLNLFYYKEILLHVKNMKKENYSGKMQKKTPFYVFFF